MSVVVKGMKMPSSCSSCRFSLTYNTTTSEDMVVTFSYTCDLDWKIKLDPHGIGNRHKDCPLIELLPHGRLIDADALENMGYNLVRYVYENGYTALEQTLLRAVPTILEAEVEE